MENTEHQAPQPRKRKKKSGCAGALLYLIIIFGVSIILSMILLFSANDVFAFIKENRAVTITVQQPTTVSELSKTLDKEGVVNYGILFKFFIQITGKDGDVAAGDYSLNPSMDYGAIARYLVNPNSTTTTIRITIPEGYTVAQIRALLLDKEVCSEEELDKALFSYKYKWDFLSKMTPSRNWLEGYLFPDTYEFYRGEDAVQVINKMLNNFNEKYDVKITEGAQERERSMHEIVTIASMVEREAQKKEEFPKIAGVIYNRLKSDMYLQIDATIQYAVGHKEKLSNADLEIDSMYNSYKYKGLPPGPIASPGYIALDAAAHPQSHGYYYYVAMPDGSHLFAKTLAAHNRNVETSKEAFAAEG